MVRIPQVSAVCGLGRSTIWVWVKAGKFPKPLKLSTRTSVWPVEEIRAWLNDPLGWIEANRDIRN
ncbi:hypothetical protein CJO09_03910 [Neopusillimonas maritima]|uniref:AlpA family transcriptional regulator n=2 Tax=Neopusillimonas maritima TaxID=2026239 RepID=A0ABX9N087_9BURK|nr:hypothetical protein CJO09_03910 [Neopusillimonas maritima]